MKLNKNKSILLVIGAILVVLFVVSVNFERTGPEAISAPSDIEITSTTDTDQSLTESELVIECPGIEFVTASFESWVTDYRVANPEATIAEEQAAWDKLLVAMNCEEFTTDNIRNTIRQLPEPTGSVE